MQSVPRAQDGSRNARLEVRISVEQKDIFQRAANLTGRSLSELVIESTQEMALKILQEQEVIRLSREEQYAFVSALLEPPAPGARLQQAARAYRQKTGV